MAFSKEWDDVYKSGAHDSQWPWSDVVALTCRYFKEREGLKVLELGCGAGANILFFEKIGAKYYGIEGSGYQANRLRERFHSQNVFIKAGDFTQIIPFDEKFDLIFDRGAITCNTTESIRNAMSMVSEKLSWGGYFFGIDWFSDKHYGFMQRYENVRKIDDRTYVFSDGYFSGLGDMHFFDRGHIEDLLSEFEIVSLEERVVTHFLPRNEIWATWNVVARKVEKGK